MYSEVDLELFAISIIRLNSAFEKLDNNEPIEEVKILIDESIDDFQKLYDTIDYDLKNNEISYNEYYLFLQYSSHILPRYIEDIEKIENDELEDNLNNLIEIFDKLNRLAISFYKMEVEQWIMI